MGWGNSRTTVGTPGGPPSSAVSDPGKDRTGLDGPGTKRSGTSLDPLHHPVPLVSSTRRSRLTTGTHNVSSCVTGPTTFAGSTTTCSYPCRNTRTLTESIVPSPPLDVVRVKM